MFVIEQVFISEQITDYRYHEGLFELSDKFSIKLNVVAISFCNAGLVFW